MDISAQSIICDSLKMRTVNVEDTLIANTVLVKRLIADTCNISGEIVAKNYLQARYVHAYKVVTVLSSIQSCNVQDFVAVPYKKRSMLLFLFASAFRAWWLTFLANESIEEKKTNNIATPVTEKQVPKTVDNTGNINEMAQAVCKNNELLTELVNQLKPKTKKKATPLSIALEQQETDAA